MMRAKDVTAICVVIRKMKQRGWPDLQGEEPSAMDEDASWRYERFSGRCCKREWSIASKLLCCRYYL